MPASAQLLPHTCVVEIDLLISNLLQNVCMPSAL